MRREVGLMRLLDRAALPDPDTLGDWLRRMGDPQTGQAGLLGLGQVRDVLTARILRRDGPKTYTLDVDATLVEGEMRTGAIKVSRATGPCWGFCSRPRSVWSMRFGKGMCRLGPGTWPSTEPARPGCPKVNGWLAIGPTVPRIRRS